MDYNKCFFWNKFNSTQLIRRVIIFFSSCQQKVISSRYYLRTEKLYLTDSFYQCSTSISLQCRIYQNVYSQNHFELISKCLLVLTSHKNLLTPESFNKKIYSSWVYLLSQETMQSFNDTFVIICNIQFKEMKSIFFL